MLTIQQLKSKIPAKLHGTSIAKIGTFYENCREAAGNVLMRIDPLNTIRRTRIENAIYDKVYNYVIASDFKGNQSLVDVRPIGERATNDYIDGRFSKQFDIKKEVNTMSIDFINGVKTLRLSKQLTPRIVLTRADSLTLEGTITSGGDVTELSIDTLDYVSGSGSIKADLDGLTGSASISFALNDPIDLSTLLDVGALFNWINFSDSTRLNSITMRWGTDSSNYWTKTVTAPHDRTAFESSAWTLQRHDWNTATMTGTPDESAIEYLSIVVSYDTGTTAIMKVDNLTAALGQAWEAVYYSNCLFQATGGGSLKEIPTADSDVILLDTEALNIFLYELQTVLIQQVKGANMTKDLEFFTLKLEGIGDKPGLYDLYEMKYPSQAIPLQEEYYTFGTQDLPNADRD